MKKRIFFLVSICLLITITYIFFMNSYQQEKYFYKEFNVFNHSLINKEKIPAGFLINQEAVAAESIAVNNEVNPDVHKIQQKRKVPQDFLEKDLHITAIGDSLTKGVGDKEGKGYLRFLENYYETNKNYQSINIKNLGIRGLKSDKLLDKLDTRKFQNAIESADMIFITIGGNDLVSIVETNFLDLSESDFTEKKDIYKENLVHIVSTIKGINPNVKIYLIGLFNPFSTTIPIPEITTIIDTWNSAIIDVVEIENDITYIPIKDIFSNPEISSHLLYKDYFHPNEYGYEKIANRIIYYIES